MVESDSAPEGTSTRAFPSGVDAVPPEAATTTPHCTSKRTDEVASLWTAKLRGLDGPTLQLVATSPRARLWLPGSMPLNDTDPFGDTSCGVPPSRATV